MSALTIVWRNTVPFCLALAGLTMLSSCATTPPPGSTGRAYRLVWTATRVADHSPLISASMSVRLGALAATRRTDSTQPTEDKPAFPAFTARLSPTRAAGVCELVTRAHLREAKRNKKGKLRFTKRDIGALVAIRPGETQVVSSASDAVRLEVRLERE